MSAAGVKRQCSSVAEQLFRKQQVVGSNPTTGSIQDQGVTAISSRVSQFSSDTFLTILTGGERTKQKTPSVKRGYRGVLKA